MNTPLRYLPVTLIAGLAINSSLSLAAVHISYDTDSFYMESSKYGYTNLSDAVTVSTSGNTVQVDFNGYVGAYASTYDYFGFDEDIVDIYAPITFSTTDGDTISGYQITFTGTYDIEDPGEVLLTDFGTYFSSSSSSPGSTAFSHTDFVSVADASLLIGQLIAYAYVDEVEVIIGYEDVLVYEEEICEYDESGAPYNCYYEPVYEQQPIYGYQTDLGLAEINLHSVTIEAQVSNIPLPGTLPLFATAIAALLGRKSLAKAKTCC